MKKIYSIAFLALMAIGGLNATAELKNPCLTLEIESGNDESNTVKIELAKNPVVTFGETDLTVTADENVSLNYQRSALRQFHFTERQDPESIAGIGADSDYTVDFTTPGQMTVRCTGLTEVKVYNVAGQLVLTAPATDGEATVRLTAIPAGIYVAEIPGHAPLKFKK